MGVCTSWLLSASATLIRGAFTWSACRVAFVAILLSTACLKLWYTEDLLAGNSVLADPSLLSAAVALEVAVSLIVLFWPARVAAITAGTVFTGFAVISGWAVLSGRECGCFGTAAHPAFPFLTDVVCLAYVALVRLPARRTGFDWPSVSGSLLIVAVALGAMLGARIFMQNVLVEQLDSRRYGENLVGKPFPLLRHPDFPVQSDHPNSCLFVILHTECERCQEFAALWATDPLDGWSSSEVFCVTINGRVWTLSCGIVSAERKALSGATQLTWKRDFEPRVITPAIVVVSGSVVKCVIDGTPALAALRNQVSKESLQKSNHRNSRVSLKGQ